MQGAKGGQGMANLLYQGWGKEDKSTLPENLESVFPFPWKFRM